MGDQLLYNGHYHPGPRAPTNNTVQCRNLARNSVQQTTQSLFLGKPIYSCDNKYTTNGSAAVAGGGNRTDIV